MGKLYVIAPPLYFTWLQEYAQVQDIGFSSLVFIAARDIDVSVGVTSPDIEAYKHLTCDNQ